MTDQQWETLLAVIRGEDIRPLPVGFIIDSPWLPNWAGYSFLDYFTDGKVWFQANMKAIETFPEAIFLPGFWSEYGMSTEPSAFGAVCTWEENEFPFAKKLLHSSEDIDPKCVHFTTGGPLFRNWEGKRDIDNQYAKEWNELYREMSEQYD